MQIKLARKAGRGAPAAVEAGKESMDIGEIIRERRTVLGMSQAQLAARLGISRNQVSNLETGKSHPSAKVLTALEEALETSFEELLANPNATPLVWLGLQKPSRGEGGAIEPVEVSMLATGPGHRVLPLRIRLAPGAQWEPGVHAQGSREHFVYVLAGTVMGRSGGRWFPLEERHALYVVGEGASAWRNAGQSTAELLWIGGQ
jgi:putative transcriptional regulator